MVRSKATDPSRGVYGISVAASLVGNAPQNLRLYEARGLVAQPGARAAPASTAKTTLRGCGRSASSWRTASIWRVFIWSSVSKKQMNAAKGARRPGRVLGRR